MSKHILQANQPHHGFFGHFLGQRVSEDEKFYHFIRFLSSSDFISRYCFEIYGLKESDAW